MKMPAVSLFKEATVKSVLLELVSRDPFCHMVVNPRTFGVQDEPETNVERAAELLVGGDTVWVEHEGNLMLSIFHLVRYKLKSLGTYGQEYARRGGGSAIPTPSNPDSRSDVGSRSDIHPRLKTRSRSSSASNDEMLERMRKLLG